jgi:hypothetical protein
MSLLYSNLTIPLPIFAGLGAYQTLRSRQEDRRLEMDLDERTTQYPIRKIDALDIARLGDYSRMIRSTIINILLCISKI